MVGGWCLVRSTKLFRFTTFCSGLASEREVCAKEITIEHMASTDLIQETFAGLMQLCRKPLILKKKPCWLPGDQ